MSHKRRLQQKMTVHTNDATIGIRIEQMIADYIGACLSSCVMIVFTMETGALPGKESHDVSHMTKLRPTPCVS